MSRIARLADDEAEELAIDVCLASWAEWFDALAKEDIEQLWWVWGADAESYLMKRSKQNSR